MKASNLRTYIIEPILEKLGLYSESAVNLLLGTAAQETLMGRYIRQIGFNLNSDKGAFGLYGHEIPTYKDDWQSFLKYRLSLSKRVEAIRDYNCSIQQSLLSDHFYSTAMARVHYLRFKEPLPAADDIKGMAKYWKKYWNTEAGKGTVEDFIENYNRYVKNA